MKPRLLIVDDEDSLLFAVEEHFIHNGFSVDCARDRRDAEVLLEHACGSGECSVAVIVDLRIGGSNDTEGLDILDHVRRRCPDTLRVLLTAHGSPEIELRAHELGDVILRKPMPLGEIARIVTDFSICDRNAAFR